MVIGERKLPEQAHRDYKNIVVSGTKFLQPLRSPNKAQDTASIKFHHFTTLFPYTGFEADTQPASRLLFHLSRFPTTLTLEELQHLEDDLACALTSCLISTSY